MKNSKYKIIKKAGVLLITWILLGSISGVFGGTVTNDDRSTTTTDNDLIINYEDAWISSLRNISYGFSINGSNADRWFNDSQDNKDTLIHNSNGEYWSVNEGNLELAINDVGTWGTVWIGDDITISSTISMDGHDGVVLDFRNHQITVDGQITAFNFTDCNYPGLINAVFNVDPTAYVESSLVGVIMLYAETDANRVDYPHFSNVHFNNVGGKTGNYNGSGLGVYTYYNYIGFDFYADGIGDTGRIFEGYFEHITMEGPFIGIRLRTDSSGYINGNTFNHVYLDAFKDSCIEFISNGSSGANINTFNIKAQTSVYSNCGIRNIDGTNNKFDSTMWDWNDHRFVRKQLAYTIGSGALHTILNERNPALMINNVSDDGLGSTIIFADEQMFYDADYDYNIFRHGDYYYARFGDFGDLPDSGSYDKTTDFEDLLKTITANSDIVIKFENGTYIPDQGIAFVGNNITIEGRGDHETIIKCLSGTAYAGGVFSMIDGTEHNLTLRNLVFSGEGASGTSIGVYFSSGEDLHSLTIENCIFTNWDAGDSKAIYTNPNTDDTVLNVKIINSEFYNCDYGVYFNGDGDPSITQWADVSHNYFKDCLYSINCDYVYNSTFSTNRIISSIGSSDGIILANSFDNIIDGNYINVISDGIIESGTANYNIGYGNNVRHSGNGMTIIGANSNFTLNIGG